MTPILNAEVETRNAFSSLSDAQYAREALAALDLDGAQPFTEGHVQRAALELRDQYAGRSWAINYVWTDWMDTVYEVAAFYLSAL
jgi:hypothetical protein